MLRWLKRFFEKKGHEPVVCKVQEFRVLYIYPENYVPRLSQSEIQMQLDADRKVSLQQEFASWSANCKAVNATLNQQREPHKLQLVA